MKATELYYPRIEVVVGDYVFDRGIQIESHSACDAYFDWARIRFTEQFEDKLQIARGTPALINLGYDNSYREVFAGYIAQSYSAGAQADEIILKDDMLLLERIQISATFQDTTPQEILTYILAQAGIRKMSLSPQVYPQRKRVPLSRVSGVQAINAVNAAWGIRQRFFFQDRVFYWGTSPAQEQVYAFEYGVNILGLTREGGEWELETVSAPFVRHSHKIEVKHPKVTGTFTVRKVVFRTTDSGFIRTHIYF